MLRPAGSAASNLGWQQHGRAKAAGDRYFSKPFLFSDAEDLHYILACLEAAATLCDEDRRAKRRFRTNSTHSARWSGQTS
jgi:hypothetical protein